MLKVKIKPWAIKKLCGLCKKVVLSILDNRNDLLRSWVPYIFIIILNFLLYEQGFVGIMFLFLVDFLIGIYLYRQNLDRKKIIRVIEKIQNGDFKAKVDTSDMYYGERLLANAVNSIGDGIEKAVAKSMRDEKLKADLITNVSHDLKTPLTSIINYTGLIKREEIANPRVKKYVDILEDKSLKLKHLTEDLLEASKICSGNIKIEPCNINFVELVNQSIGEFYDRFDKKRLVPIFSPGQKNIEIYVDPRHLWRVIDNLIGNVCKYALAGTRIYMDMGYLKDGTKVFFSIKNISSSDFVVEAADLTERFIRGDVSRTTDGSGLGLSIVQSLVKAQGGEFKIRIDGDIFKAIILLPIKSE